MITIKDKISIEKMAAAGKLLANLYEKLSLVEFKDLTTLEVDSIIEKYLISNNMVSCSKGYFGYKHVSCISLNDVVVHGVPSSEKIKDGDLVKIDICASFNGYCADMARCFFVGQVSPDVKAFVQAAQKALDKGIEKAVPGNRIGDISAAIQKEVESRGFGVVREFAGHGIGKKMHEDPEILNYGRPGMGPLIRPGMAFAIEPMITMGDYKVYIKQDGWTVKTTDKSLAAHVEDTVIVTEDGPKIITRL